MIDSLVKLIVGFWVVFIIGGIVLVVTGAVINYPWLLIPLVLLIIGTVTILILRHRKATKKLNESIQKLMDAADAEKKATIPVDETTIEKTESQLLSPITEGPLTISDIKVPIIERIDGMQGREFEEFMFEFFTKKGYATTLTPLSGDYGIDLIIEHEFGKIGVQLKRYYDKVGNSAVQEVVAGLKHYNLSSGMVITNNFFQPSAIQLAKDNNIILWDRNKLIEELQK